MSTLSSSIREQNKSHHGSSECSEASNYPKMDNLVGIRSHVLEWDVKPTLSSGNQEYLHNITLNSTTFSALFSIGISPGTSPGSLPQQQLMQPEQPLNTLVEGESNGGANSRSDRAAGTATDAVGTSLSGPGKTHFFADAKENTDVTSHKDVETETHHSAHRKIVSSKLPLNQLQVTTDSPTPALVPRHNYPVMEGQDNSEPVPIPTQGIHLPHTPPLVESPPYSQAQSTSAEPLTQDYSESDPDYQAVKIAAECLHAQDYSKMAATLQRAPDTLTVLFGRGLAYYKLAKYSLATAAFEQVLERSKNDPNLRKNLYLAHYYIGEIDLGHSRYESASYHFEQAVVAFSVQSLAKRYRVVPPSKSILFSKRGSAQNHCRKVMAAIESYKQAIALAGTSKDNLAAHTSLGNLYQSIGDNQSALQQYESTVKLAEMLGDFIYLGWAHGNMGNAFLGLHQKDKALHHLEKSLELTVEHEPSPQAIGRAYNNLGTAYQSLCDVNKAEEYYDLALSQAIYGRDAGGQARAYGNIGNLLVMQKKYEPAIVHYTEAMNIGKDRSTKSTAFHNRGCANYEKAEADKKQFLDSMEKKPTATSTQEKDYLITYKGPNVHRLSHIDSTRLPESIRKNYEQGRDDLKNVVENHEETIQTIKGSTRGLTLSVSLSETNSRTFHRLQDCLYNLEQLDSALVYAEQSRARSLGELLLERKGRQLDRVLTSPLSIAQIEHVVEYVNTTIVFLSYTGSRLLVWVFTPINGYFCQNMFQVSLSDDQFEGKSLDYYLRYSLSELLIENNLEMYSVTMYDSPSPLEVLYELFGRPLINILQSVHSQTNTSDHDDSTKDIIIVPDSYTSLMPFVALQDTSTRKFLGDKFRFRFMPSLLTIGVLCQLPEVVVEVLEESRNFCVIGNPSIPPFKYQGETWNLGRLPHATKEAEWVAHILKCSPTLHEQATKTIAMSMMNTARVVHLATHGSATSGFLAFAGMGSSRSKEVSDEKLVLMYPEEVEKQSISSALVVLSSCDSGRGVVKADGIQGMARAFIVAGAQSVLTSLWRVPDESASTFMQFFYQYLMDGFQSSRALQMAILSVRSFSKYSRYIHWSGYQLTGREVRLVVQRTPQDLEVKRRVGVCAVFPRLHIVKKLENSFVKKPRVPTDVQLIHGLYGLKPAEPVIEFILKYHTHFTGGVFWVNGTCPEFVCGAELEIAKAMTNVPSPSLLPSALVVLENFASLPQPGPLLSLLKNNNSHVIVICSNLSVPANLQREIDQELIRGLNVTSVKSLSPIHSTQRMVHSIIGKHDFTPHNREQALLVEIANKVGGSPTLLDITSSLLGKCIDECNDKDVAVEDFDFLSEFSERVLVEPDPDPQSCAEASSNVEDEHLSISNYTAHLLDGFCLSPSEHLILSSLAMFGPVPIPKSVLDITQTIVMMAKPSSEAPGTLVPISNLLRSKLLLVYPSSVLVSPSLSTKEQTSYSQSRLVDLSHLEEDADYYYVPQLVQDTLWDRMSDLDIGFSITVAYKSLEQLGKKLEVKKGSGKDSTIIHFTRGLVLMLTRLLESKGDLVKESVLLNLSCYQETVRLYFNFHAD